MQLFEVCLVSLPAQNYDVLNTLKAAKAKSNQIGD